MSGVFDGFTNVELALVITYASSALSFLAVYGAAAARVGSEIVLIKRFLRLLRATALLLMVDYFILLYYELKEWTGVVWPSFGVARPIAGLLLVIVAFQAGTHVCFRWIAFAGPIVIIVSDTLTYTGIKATIACREDGSCDVTNGFDVADLRVQEWRAVTAMFLEVWLMLFTAAVAISQGVWTSRYPVRLFSGSNPVSEVPESRGGHSWDRLEQMKVS